MTVSIEQAQLALKELIEKSSNGESVVITQGNLPVAELRPIATGKRVPVFGSCKGMLSIVADDDEHLADFAEYLK
jgi:antitoxin (DNA-binding transcriptional repressor) of toxin-antitoxin stability system